MLFTPYDEFDYDFGSFPSVICVFIFVVVFSVELCAVFLSFGIIQ